MSNESTLEMDWIDAQEIQEELRLTPFQFCEVLERGELESNLHDEFIGCRCQMTNEPFFKTSDIKTLRIHHYSYWDYCSKNKINSEILRWFPFPYIPWERAAHLPDPDQVSEDDYLSMEEDMRNNLPWIDDQEELSSDEWLPAEKVRKHLFESPARFCKLLNSGELETEREEERENHYQAAFPTPFFKSSDLSHIHIFHISYMEYCERSGMPTTLFPRQKQTIIPKTEGTENLQKIIAELRTENARLKKEMEFKQTGSQPEKIATKKGYSPLMSAIIKAALDIKADWDNRATSDTNTSKIIRHYGYKADELWKIAPQIVGDKVFMQNFKRALNDNKIKVHLKRAPRTLPDK